MSKYRRNKVYSGNRVRKNNMQARSVPEDPTDGLRQRVSPSTTYRSDRMERDAKNEDNFQSCLEQIKKTTCKPGVSQRIPQMAYDRGLVHLPLLDQTEWKEMLRMRIIFKVVWNR